MADTHRRIIPEGLQKIFLKILSPLISLFTKWGLSPNFFTIAGLIITSLAAAAFIAGYIRPGGVLILLGGLCDTFDGSIARSTDKSTRFGAFFDSVIDRYSEFVLFLGIGAHFVLNHDVRLGEINLNISVELPKSKPEIETICDLIPGALITEREKQEMLGVKIIGIPDERKLFLPDDFPEGIYPWRKDDTGPEKLYKNLHEVKK